MKLVNEIGDIFKNILSTLTQKLTIRWNKDIKGKFANFLVLNLVLNFNLKCGNILINRKSF